MRHYDRWILPRGSAGIGGLAAVLVGVTTLFFGAEQAWAFPTGAGAGGGPHVRVFEDRGDLAFPGEQSSFFAYDAAFTGGVAVAMRGNLVATGAGAGGGPHVRVFSIDPATGAATERASFFAYAPGFTGGVSVALSDCDGDGDVEVVTAAGAGGGPHVRVFEIPVGQAPVERAGFFAYATGFTGGVRVAAADLDGDGRDEIVTSPGAGGGPHIRVFDGGTSGFAFTASDELFAYDPGFLGGVFVAAADLTGDGKAEVVTGAGRGGGPHVRVLEGLGRGVPIVVRDTFPFDPGFTGGVRVATAPLDAGAAGILAAAGAGGGPHVRGFRVSGSGIAPLETSFFAYAPSFTGGVLFGGQGEGAAAPQPTPRPSPTPPETPQFFPAGAPWTRDVSTAAVDPASPAIIAALESAGGFGLGEMRIDFSIHVLEGDASTPFRTFTKNQNFFEPDCDETSMPVPPGGAVEGESGYECVSGGDCHLIVHHRPTRTLYEMFSADIRGDAFSGGCLAVWDLNRVYPAEGRGDQCTSADAAGFPMAPLLFTIDEVVAGEIPHAIRFILPNNRLRNRVYVRPATHSTGATSAGQNGVPYGARFRLRSDFPLETLPSDAARTVARALQRFGMLMSDGGVIALTGASDRGSSLQWADVLGPRDLRALQVTDFEMIDAGERFVFDGNCVRTP